MLKGKVQAALKWITSNGRGKVLGWNEALWQQNHQMELRAVYQSLTQ